MGNKKRHKAADTNSGLPVSDCQEWTLVKGEIPGRALVLKLLKPETCENWFQERFVKPSCALEISIPKQLVGLDEKYMKQCLELIHMNALQESSCAVFMNSSSIDMGFVSDHTYFGNRTFAVDYPVTVGAENLVLSYEDEGIVGSIMGSNNMMGILGSPLFQKLGMSDQDARLGGTNFFENKKCISSESSPGRLASSQSPTPSKETILRNQKYQYDSAKKSTISDSGLGSGLPTDHQLSESSSSQGMLHCTWENGFPQFSFSLDDQKELYVANAARAEVIHEKALDYVYSFHVQASERKLSDIPGIESDLMGKMKVSTSFSLCSGNSKVMETEFVLVGTNDIHGRENHPFSQNSRRGRKLSKVMEMFKAGPSHKQRSPSILGGSTAILEDFSVGKDFLPNLELAAIVVKDHVQNEDHQEEVGGWGLKFLKKSRVKPTMDSSNVVVLSECCRCDAINCSTSTDIILPAGPHGGPRSRNAGPSSLTERWKSNGHCDCGGWDLGCPLKVLKVTPRREGGRLNSEAQGHCKSFDMIIEGSEKAPPTMKMVNIRDGLYFISFQSSLLSALQCFAIAVAIYHSKSPSLSPKHFQNG